jgi:hypothetical protein
MPAITNWNNTDITLWAVINGTEIAITRYQSTSGLQMLPMAKIWCALGTKASTGEVAAIHELIPTLTLQTPIQIYADIEEIASGEGTTDDWPAASFIVFDGVIINTGFTKSRDGGATFTIDIAHWAVALEYSWTPTQATQPLGIGAFNMPAGAKITDGTVNFVPSTTALEFFTAGNIQSDYWNLAVRPFLTARQRCLHLCSSVGYQSLWWHPGYPDGDRRYCS